MLIVLLLILGVGQYVINEQYHQLIKIGLKYSVHYVYKYCRGISQSERHYKEFRMPRSDFEGSLRYVILFNL